MIDIFKNQFVDALLSGSKEDADQIVADARNAGISVARIYLDVISPSQVRLGELWHDGTITPSQENLGTSITLGIMATLARDIPASQPHGFRAIVTPIEGDHHFVGARIFADFLTMDGWKTDFLSNPAQVNDLVEFVHRRPTDIVAISCTLPKFLPNVNTMAKALHTLEPRPKILLGGASLNTTGLDIKSLGCDGAGLSVSEGLKEARRLVGLTEHKLTLEDHLTAIGHRIRSVRTSHQMTQKQLADRSGVARAYISMVEQGKQNLTIGAVVKIADALGVSIDELLVFPDN